MSMSRLFVKSLLIDTTTVKLASHPGMLKRKATDCSTEGCGTMPNAVAGKGE